MVWCQHGLTPISVMQRKERKTIGQPPYSAEKAKTLNKISVNDIKPSSVYFTNSRFHLTFENHSVIIIIKEKHYHFNRYGKTWEKIQH